MTGIFPNTSAGGVVVRDTAGNAINPPSAPANVHRPGIGFEMTGPQTAHAPTACPLPPDPGQMNAILSEILAFAEALNPAGPWTIETIGNLAAAFIAWRDGLGVGSLREAARAAIDVPGLEADVAAQVALAAEQVVLAAAQAAAAAASAAAASNNANGIMAANTIKANLTNAAAAPTDATAAQIKAFLAIAIGDVAGLTSALAGKASTGANTFSGNQDIAKAEPALNLNKAASGQGASVYGRKAGLIRWGVILGDSIAETGSNLGSRFLIGRFDDAGNWIDAPVVIDRDTGYVWLEGYRPAKLTGDNNFTATNVFNQTVNQAISAVNATTGVEARAAGFGVGAGAAYVTFHRAGAHALALGLDTDNVVKLGGWSYGAPTPIITAANIANYAPSPKWINYDGVGNTIRASSGFASVTDNGTGNYTFNFTTAMPDANYAVVLGYSNEANGSHTVGFVSDKTTTSFRVKFFSDTNSSALADKAICDILVMR